MVGGLSGVNVDVPPYVMVEGERARVVGLNVIGLRRNGVTPVARDGIRKAVRLLYHSGLSRPSALEAIARDCPPSDELQGFVDFMRAVGEGRNGRQLERPA